MSTKKQIVANKKNALRSTGPQTLRGKITASQNSIKHGILSNELLLTDESEDAFTQLRNRIWAELNPAGAMEAILSDRIVFIVWRLLRIGRIETSLLEHVRCEELVAQSRRNVQKYEKNALGDFSSLKEITDHQKHAEAEVSAEVYEELRDNDETFRGRAFMRDAQEGNNFEKLTRYEAGFERSLFRNLHELQRLQAARNGGNVPPPLVVDLNLDTQGRDA